MGDRHKELDEDCRKMKRGTERKETERERD